METNINRILALGRLYEFCSNKRFHLIKNDFIDDSIGKLALELNNVIWKTNGINLFEATSESDLIEYGKMLNNLTTEYSNQFFGYKTIGDEMELFKISESFPKDKMKSYDYNIRPIVKGILKDFSLTVPNITVICKNPDCVVFIKELNSYFLISKAKIKHRNMILLIHLIRDDNSQVTTSIPNHQKLQSFSLMNTKAISNHLLIQMVMFFSDEISSEFKNDPIKLFIKGLDYYGADVEINNRVKKFHLNVILPPHLDSIDNYYNIDNTNKDHVRTISATRLSNIATTVIFLYTIKMGKMLRDFMNGKI